LKFLISLFPFSPFSFFPQKCSSSSGLKEKDKSHQVALISQIKYRKLNTGVEKINREITIAGKKYSEKALQLVLGRENIMTDIESISEEMLLLAEVIEAPLKLPGMLETFYTMKIKNEKAFHFALLRVQVDSDLHIHEDIQKYQQRKYVAETLEKLVYGELMLNGEGLGMDVEGF